MLYPPLYDSNQNVSWIPQKGIKTDHSPHISLFINPKDSPVDSKGTKVTNIFDHIWYSMTTVIFCLHSKTLPTHYYLVLNVLSGPTA